MLALWGRAEIRDYVDVAALHNHYTSATLLQLAAAKDTGFTSHRFADALDAIRRFEPEDWAAAGIGPEHATRIHDLVVQWSRDLRAS
jgi:hypothetical protein